MYNAGDRKDVRRLEKAARLAEAQRLEIIRGIMSVAPGRAWVLGKLEDSHIFATSFSSDPLQMAFAEGERNCGLKLLNDIMAACPDAYMLMMQERNERDATRDTVRRNAASTDGNGRDQGPVDDSTWDASGDDDSAAAEGFAPGNFDR